MSELFRPCVGIVLMNEANKIFAGERIDNPGAWQMPQGGIDDGEDVETAFYRELKEEVGTDKADIVQILPETTRYRFPDTVKHRLYGGIYVGQEQSWVQARFTGRETDIDLRNFDPPEFRAYDWYAPDDLLDLIVPFKKDTYKKVFAMLNL